MKVEINFKNKVRFFGQYWGQEVFVNPFLGSVPVHNVYVFEYSDPEDIGRECLLLKPISLISEEDIDELKKICGYKDTVDAVGFALTLLGKPFNRLNIPTRLVISATDFLRSRGYALPWMGLSVGDLIKAGWIKLTEA